MQQPYSFSKRRRRKDDGLLSSPWAFLPSRFTGTADSTAAAVAADTEGPERLAKVVAAAFNKCARLPGLSALPLVLAACVARQLQQDLHPALLPPCAQHSTNN